VLTIDPTSKLTGGSILGDKTRMQDLAKNPKAFIRPTPSGHTLGGVAAFTRESILFCEAAGFEMILVETVGTGQSEIAIKSMVDFFLLLMQPGSGDELQGIKKGIVEMADAIVITKADGDNINPAKATQADFQHALHFSQTQPSGWIPKVLTSSALESRGFLEIITMIETFQNQLSASGYFQSHRKSQHDAWFKEHFSYLLSIDPKQFSNVRDAERQLTDQIDSQTISPRRAAQQLLEEYHKSIRQKN
jgi:LAO/AO transport system kinase